MDTLIKYHQDHTVQEKYNCEKTNNNIIKELYHYDNDSIPILINAIIELKERICCLEKDKEKSISQECALSTSTIKGKKPLPLNL